MVWPDELIARLAGVSENTMRDHFGLYAAGGLDKLKEVNLYRPTSALHADATSLEAHFREHPPATINEAQHEIAQLTGFKRSETQEREFLKKLHLRCRKVGRIPAKADPEQQAAYLKHELEPRLAEAQAGQRAVFFVDAAHFVRHPFSASCGRWYGCSSSPGRAATLQCLGGLECGLARTHYGDP